MKMCEYISYPLLILSILLIQTFFSSCQHDINKELSEVEQSIYDNPDSIYIILKNMQPFYEDMLEEEKALFDLRLFQTSILRDDYNVSLQKADESIKYFLAKNDQRKIADGYYAQALYHKEYRDYNQAITLLLKAREITNSIDHSKLNPHVYFHLGHIACMQERFESGAEYLNRSIEIFEKQGDYKRMGKTLYVLGIALQAQGEYDESTRYFQKAIPLTPDSTTVGDILIDIGNNYYQKQNFDSAQFYFQKSLTYPAFSSNMSLRYYYIGNMYSQLEQYDSVQYYIGKAFEHSIDIYIAEECYRLLTQMTLAQKDTEKAAEYVRLRAACNDSIIKIEQQPNIDIVEQVHNVSIENQKYKTSQMYMWISIAVLTTALFVTLVIVRRKGREKTQVKEKLAKQKEAVKHMNTRFMNEQEQKITAFKHELELFVAKRTRKAKSSSFAEKQQNLKDAYSEYLHLDSEKDFIVQMNHWLADLPDKLISTYPEINYKEIVWCCLFVLDFSTTDISLILNYTQSSQYKFKQRLAKKLYFNNTKELEEMLHEKMSIKVQV